MCARVLVVIVCCGLGQVSALRFTPDGVSEWLARLNASVATVVAGHNFVRDAPVLLTAADEGYKDFFAPWASKAEEVGFAQKFVVALTQSTLALCGTLNLPSVLVDTDNVNMPPPTSAAHYARLLPGQLPFAKFGVPHVLLQSGFDSVVLSEMDVFFFASPLPMLADFRSRTGAHVLAMPDVKGFHEKWAINIGFMMLGHGSETLLLKFLSSWWKKRTEAFDVAADQQEFQKFVGRFVADDAVKVELLDEKFFAVRPGDVGPETVVLHTAWAPSRCKVNILKSVYKGLPVEVLAQRVAEGNGTDCPL